MNSDLPPSPEDHPIQEIWKIGGKLNNLQGLIDLAKSGDTDAALHLLHAFSYRQLQRQEHPVEHKRQIIHTNLMLNYLAECFYSIISGIPADIALNLKISRKGRPELTPTAKMKHCDIGHSVVACMNQEGLSLEEASEKVSKTAFVSASTVKKAYLKYMVIPPSSRTKK